jgi:hypothetical protein
LEAGGFVEQEINFHKGLVAYVMPQDLAAVVDRMQPSK